MRSNFPKKITNLSPVPAMDPGARSTNIDGVRVRAMGGCVRQINGNVKGGSTAERLFVPSPKPKHFLRPPASMTSVVRASPVILSTLAEVSSLLWKCVVGLSPFPCTPPSRSSQHPSRGFGLSRHPAALNGGRVVYLNGYWVAWPLAASCPNADQN